MSVAGQVIAQVRELIEEAASVLHRKDAAQDKRMDAIEERLGALESPSTSAATAAPRARKNVKAQAGTAEGTASASSARGEASSA